MKFGKPVFAVVFIGTIAIAAYFLSQVRGDTFGYQQYRIPKDELRVVDPHPGCDYIHYHAAQVDSVTATDGTILVDATDCGYGPVR